VIAPGLERQDVSPAICCQTKFIDPTRFLPIVSAVCAPYLKENKTRVGDFAGCLLLYFDWMRQATGAAVFWRWRAPSMGKAKLPRMTVLLDRAERPGAPLRVIRGFGSCCIAGAVYP